MQLIGTIVHLQVQTTSLKVAGTPFRRYDPAGLVGVPKLMLDDGGVWGETGAGERIGDVHHRDHPASKNRGLNPISICFTGHYTAMRERFGDVITDGIAGENIFVDYAGLIGEPDLEWGLVIERADGTLVGLDHVVVAAPCVEFSRYALRYPEAERPDLRVTEALQFLSDGMRGYYACYGGPGARIAVGDRVHVR